MTAETLTGLLAAQVMHWGVDSKRFSMGGRRWTPRWRFQPIDRLEDAFRLLDAASPQEYSICGDGNGNIHVRVRIRGTAGEARDSSRPRALTVAIARALGIEIEDGKQKRL